MKSLLPARRLCCRLALVWLAGASARAQSAAPSRPALVVPAAPASWSARAQVGAQLEPLRLDRELAVGTPAPLDVTLRTALRLTPSVDHLLEVTQRRAHAPPHPAPTTTPWAGAVPESAVLPLAGDATSKRGSVPRLSPRYKWAYTTAAIGLASLGLMAGFGLRAVFKEREHKAGCSALGCSNAALEAFDSAKGSARVSHVFGITSAASLGVSAYLYFFRNDAKPRRMVVMPIFGLAHDVGLAAGGMTMKGSW